MTGTRIATLTARSREPRIVVSDAVNEMIRLHQDHLETLRLHHNTGQPPWSRSSLLAELNRWAERMDQAFCLCLPPPVISVEREHKSRLGSFWLFRNGLAIQNVITINELYIQAPLPEVLITLAHELLHMWQHEHGSPPDRARFHNKQFIEKSNTLGLKTNGDGVVLGIVPGPFITLLERHGLSIEPTPADELLEYMRPNAKTKIRRNIRGASKVRWACPCGPIWVDAGRRLQALCLACDSPFELQPQPKPVKPQSSPSVPAPAAE